MKKTFVILFLTISSPLAFSQGTFPLHIGDTRQYLWMNTTGHVSQRTTIVTQTVEINGYTYFVLSGEQWPFFYLRHSGDTLKTFTKDSTGELTVFHRWMQVGDSLEWGLSEAVDPNWAQVIDIDTTQAMFGDSHTLRVRWTIGIVYPDYPYPSTVYWIIEDSLGIVGWAEGAMTGSWGDLIGAKIDGRLYGSMTSVPKFEEHIPNSPIVLAVYPNPFNSQTTAIISTAVAGGLRVTLHDLLGRQLEVVYWESAVPGTTVVPVSLSPYSSGAYWLSASIGGKSVAKRLMLLR